MPVEIEFRASLPKTAVGKLSKKELVAEELTKRQPPAARSVQLRLSLPCRNDRHARAPRDNPSGGGRCGGG